MMPLRINGKEPASLFVGAREVQRAVLNGKTVYELLRTVALVKAASYLWESIPTNSLCYPMQEGKLNGVVFRYPVTCSKYCRSWKGDYAGGGFSAGSTIPAGTGVCADFPNGEYVFTRV